MTRSKKLLKAQDKMRRSESEGLCARVRRSVYLPWPREAARTGEVAEKLVGRSHAI